MKRNLIKKIKAKEFPNKFSEYEKICSENEIVGIKFDQNRGLEKNT